MLSLTMVVLPLSIISVPSPQKILFLMIGWLLPKKLYIPPPLLPAVLPLKVTFVTVGLLVLLYIPPPLLPAVLPLKVTFVSVGLLLPLNIPLPLSIPPPLAPAVLPLKVTLVSVGLL